MCTPIWNNPELWLLYSRFPRQSKGKCIGKVWLWPSENDSFLPFVRCWANAGPSISPTMKSKSWEAFLATPIFVLILILCPYLTLLLTMKLTKSSSMAFWNCLELKTFFSSPLPSSPPTSHHLSTLFIDYWSLTRNSCFFFKFKFFLLGFDMDVRQLRQSQLPSLQCSLCMSQLQLPHPPAASQQSWKRRLAAPPMPPLMPMPLMPVSGAASDAGSRLFLKLHHRPPGSAHTTPVFLFAVSSCFSCSLCVLLFLSICACLFVGPASGSLRNGTLGKIK